MYHLIWDLDGTLIDSSREIKNSIELSVKKSGIDISKQIKPFVVGPTIDKILREAFPIEIMTDCKLKETIKYFREIYDYSNFDLTKPYSSIEEIIFDRIHFVHHIVTNKPDFPTRKIIDKLNWSKYITSISTPYSTPEIKSKPEIFSDIIAKYEADSSLFAGIGDMKTDCIAAKNNNITTLGVLWGSGTQEELQEYCDCIFHNAKQLMNYLSNKYKQMELS